MQTLTEQVFLLAPPGGLFTETVVANVFPSRSQGARRLMVHRAVASGEVLRLKRGIYLLAPPWVTTPPSSAAPKARNSSAMGTAQGKHATVIRSAKGAQLISPGHRPGERHPPPFPP